MIIAFLTFLLALFLVAIFSLTETVISLGEENQDLKKKIEALEKKEFPSNS